MCIRDQEAILEHSNSVNLNLSSSGFAQILIQIFGFQARQYGAQHFIPVNAVFQQSVETIHRVVAVMRLGQIINQLLVFEQQILRFNLCDFRLMKSTPGRCEQR